MSCGTENLFAIFKVKVAARALMIKVIIIIIVVISMVQYLID